MFIRAMIMVMTGMVYDIYKVKNHLEIESHKDEGDIVVYKWDGETYKYYGNVGPECEWYKNHLDDENYRFCK